MGIDNLSDSDRDIDTIDWNKYRQVQYIGTNIGRYNRQEEIQTETERYERD